MKFDTYVKKLQKLLETHPDYAKMTVVATNEDAMIVPVNPVPVIGIALEGEFIDVVSMNQLKDDEELKPSTKPDIICIS